MSTPYNKATFWTHPGHGATVRELRASVNAYITDLLADPESILWDPDKKTALAKAQHVRAELATLYTGAEKTNVDIYTFPGARRFCAGDLDRILQLTAEEEAKA